jgi:hypothetical protein
MDSFRQTLEEHSGKVGICHNSQTSDENKNKLKNVNENWTQYDFVLSNNVLTVGVNFDVEYFDQCYLFIAPFNEMRDIVQFSYRPRNLNDDFIKFCFIGEHFNKNNSQDKLDKHHRVTDYAYKHLRNSVLIEQTSPVQETFFQFLIMAGYTISPDVVEIEKRELQTIKLLQNSETYYDYNSIKKIDESSLAGYETEFYSNNCSFETKLMLRKYHFANKFKEDADEEVISEAWDKNYIKLVDDIKYLLCGVDTLMDKLKNDYKWELHFPEVIKDFTFDKETLRAIFDSGFCSRKLDDKSKHHLILKSYINHYFNSDVIKSDSNKHTNYVVNDKFKKIYILIKNNVCVPPRDEDDDIQFV